MSLSARRTTIGPPLGAGVGVEAGPLHGRRGVSRERESGRAVGARGALASYAEQATHMEVT